jgi:hypothetical protein
MKVPDPRADGKQFYLPEGFPASFPEVIRLYRQNRSM